MVTKCFLISLVGMLTIRSSLRDHYVLGWFIYDYDLVNIQILEYCQTLIPEWGTIEELWIFSNECGQSVEIYVISGNKTLSLVHV